VEKLLMSKFKKTIYWLRNDLRLSDNPALSFACNNSDEIIIIFILDEINHRNIGQASKWYLHHSLENLNHRLNNKINFYNGDSTKILNQIIEQNKVDSLVWNRCYEPSRIKQDSEIKKNLKTKIEVESFNGSLLFEPWEVLKNDQKPYKVFTHYYRNGCLKGKAPRSAIKKPDQINAINIDDHLKLKDLKLLPKIKWDKIMKDFWQIGEEASHEKLQNFVKNSLSDYKEGRNFPNQKKVSCLSPHLHFGEISAHQVWQYANTHFSDKLSDKNLDCFLSELGWREFSYYLLYHFPKIVNQNFQPRFDHFTWQKNQKLLSAWQKGQTGYPIVDAGMRELWQTGYMHNRVRMIVGSFLVKNLLIDWRDGEAWFWDCLVDADLASNCASWQWVAGCGADAAPYFRIFNPVLQGEKFDADGEYTKKFVPELKNLPNKYLFTPWLADKKILQQANVELGKNYPHPIIDLESSRNMALQAFKALPKISNEDKLHY
jgi:deoxyribodipyrimidine photo-lyase